MSVIASIFTSFTYYPPVAQRIPAKIPICLTAILIRVVYNIAVAWEYNIGPLNAFTNVAYIYALGYAPIIFCMLIMCIWARIEVNEDLQIKELRREAEQKIDNELGIGPGQAQPPKGFASENAAVNKT